MPPVLIQVEGSGTSFDEMHVDGGTTVPFFIAPYIVETVLTSLDELRGANVYVLLNRQLDVASRTTRDKTLPVFTRSMSATLRLLYRTTLELSARFAQRYSMNLRVSAIPSEYPLQRPFRFRTPILQRLVVYAADCAQSGQLWTSAEQALERKQGSPTSAAGPVQCPSAQASRQR